MPLVKLTFDFHPISFFAFLQSKTKLNFIVGAVTFFILILLPAILIINFAKSNIFIPISEPQL